MRLFIRNKRGMSSVIGAIFAGIIFLAGFSFIMWQATQYDNQAQVVAERNRLDIDRKNEQIAITNASIQSDHLMFSVMNEGAVTARIVDIWITEYTDITATAHQGPIASNVSVNPGSTTEPFMVFPPSLDPNKNYVIKAVTERGNIVSQLVQPAIAPGTGGDFSAGPFVLIFSDDSFQYTSNNNPTTAEAAFQTDNDRNRIVYQIKVKNQAGESIQISSLSFFMVVVRELLGSGAPGNTEDERYFHIVGNTSDSTSYGLVAYPDYSQTILSGETATLKFGASSVGLGGNNFLSYPLRNGGSAGHETYDNLLWTFLVIFWRYEGSTNRFGQTIAYTAIRATP